METNRIEEVARDGIHTVAQVTRTAVRSTAEVAVDAADAVRTVLDGWIDTAGSVARRVVRVSATVLIELADSLRTTAQALVTERRAREFAARTSARMDTDEEDHRLSA